MCLNGSTNCSDNTGVIYRKEIPDLVGYGLLDPSDVVTGAIVYEVYRSSIFVSRASDTPSQATDFALEFYLQGTNSKRYWRDWDQSSFLDDYCDDVDWFDDCDSSFPIEDCLGSCCQAAQADYSSMFYDNRFEYIGDASLSFVDAHGLWRPDNRAKLSFMRVDPAQCISWYERHYFINKS